MIKTINLVLAIKNLLTNEVDSQEQAREVLEQVQNEAQTELNEVRRKIAMTGGIEKCNPHLLLRLTELKALVD